MEEKNNTKRIEALLEKMKKERGYVLPPLEYAVKQDVDFMEAYNNLYQRVLMDGKALSAKTREFITIALLSYRGQDHAVYEHAKRAMRLGASRQELLEAIETSTLAGGAPAFATGLKALMRIDKEKQQDDSD
jgi:alkylhydroperoxidase/carboxymuconolactone decarboxylase family protein YurZ